MNNNPNHQVIVIRARVVSKQARFPTIEFGSHAILVNKRRIVKVGKRKYEYKTVIVHPTTNFPVLIPPHSWGYLKWNGKEWIEPVTIGSAQWGDDHNPDLYFEGR